MNCKYCNGENADNAVFCQHCGKRIDGKLICPSCGNANEPDTTFCRKCGVRLDGKTVCTSCGTLVEGKFCPNCGKAVDGPVGFITATANNAESAQTLTGWKKPILLTGNILGLIGVIASLIFVFFIGMTPYLEGVYFNDAYVAARVGDFINLKWFFGDGIKNLIRNINPDDGQNALAYALRYLFPAMFGTAIFTGVIIAVFVMTIIAIVRYAKVLSGKQTKGVEKITVAVFLTYAMGVAWIKALFTFRYSLEYSGGYALNGATVAGLVICSILVSLHVATRIAVKGKSLINRNSILKLSFAAAGIVLTAVLWSACSGVVGGYRSKFVSKISASYGFIPMMREISINAFNAEEIKQPVLIATMALVGQLLLFAIVPIALATISGYMRTAYGDKHNSTLAASICLAVFSTLFLVVGIIAVNSLNTFLGNPEDWTPVYVGPIVAFVMAVLNLGVSIADKVCSKKYAY